MPLLNTVARSGFRLASVANGFVLSLKEGALQIGVSTFNNKRFTLKNLGWLLIFIPALCTCSLVLMVIFHYFHIIESGGMVVNTMFVLLAINVFGCIAICVRTSGHLPYLLFGNLLFFIIFVFSITAVRNHNCNHHEQEEVFQYGVHQVGDKLDIGVDARCDNCD